MIAGGRGAVGVVGGAAAGGGAAGRAAGPAAGPRPPRRHTARATRTRGRPPASATTCIGTRAQH